MKARHALLLPLFTLLAACGAEKAETVAIDAKRIRAHMEFLADDLLEGRNTGERGHEIAAAYFATQCKLMGLEPAGEEGSYFQQVPFRSSRLVEATGTLTLQGEARALVAPNDIRVDASHAAAEESGSGAIVFAGWGISAPEFGYDDYASLDVEGKVVMLVARGAPDIFPSTQRAYYSSGSYKIREAVRRGARGVLFLTQPAMQARFTWEQVLGYSGRPSLEWIAPDGSVPNAHPELAFVATPSYALQAELLEFAPLPAEEVYEKLKAAEPVAFELPAEIAITRKSAWEEIRSPNVACMLPGSDPVLRDEYVVFTGHLDHVGVREREGEEDAIHNGAYDNAAGIAMLLEAARAYTGMEEKPKRSLIFLAVTAEEKGLLGSDYWARHPTVPMSKVVANVNIDMPVLTFTMADVIAYGAEHSEIGDIVAARAAEVELAVGPDPWPEEVIFVRSDQYSFVRAGVPSLFLVPGWQAAEDGVDGPAEMRAFLETHYHKPSDDLALPFSMDAAERFTRLNWLVGLDIANRDAPVQWRPGDFFGERFPRAAE